MCCILVRKPGAGIRKQEGVVDPCRLSPQASETNVENVAIIGDLSSSNCENGEEIQSNGYAQREITLTRCPE
jgi:hypothetical protein